MKLSRNRPPMRPLAGFALAALLSWAGGAAAQVDAANRTVREVERQRRLDELQQFERENRYRANEEIPLEQRALIDYGGYTTLQYLSVDDRDNNNHGLRQADFFLYGRLNLDGANEIFARGRISHYDFNRGDNFFTLQKNGWSDADLDRGYYRFDLSRYEAAYKGRQIEYNVVAQAGRDLVYWGNGLTMGMVIDGGLLDLTWRDLTLELIAGITPVRTVDIDTSRPAFDYNTRRGFYGGMFTWNPNTPNFGRHHPYVYVLSQRDYNSHDFLQQGPIATKFEYDSWYIGAGSTGSLGDHLLYGAEVAYEGGHTLSNSFRVNGFALEQVHQTQDQIQALATSLRLDYLLNDPRNTRFGVELILASGDPDRGHSTNTFNGNRPNTRDLSFNGFGLINTGLAFAPEVSNLNALQFSASTYPLATVQPFRRLQVGTDLFVYNKLRANGGFVERTENAHFLGVEPDAYLNWQITSDVTLAVRYGIFFPTHNVIQHEANRQFLYTGVTFAF